jgi:hypothetical protein
MHEWDSDVNEKLRSQPNGKYEVGFGHQRGRERAEPFALDNPPLHHGREAENRSPWQARAN